MRRGLITATLAAPALLLGACSGSGDDEPPTTADPTGTVAEETSTEGAEPAVTTEASDDDTDDRSATTADPEGVEGGEDGQAAADVAHDFLVAMVAADPAACDYLLSFTDLQKPMSEVESDHEMCVELLPEVLKAQTEAQGLDEESAAALEALQINGADVDGDTAVVDADNYGNEFAAAMGDAEIALKKIDGQWYVDLDNSFTTATTAP